MKGYEFTVGNLHYPPFIFKSFDDQGRERFSGMEMDLANFIAYKHNFKFVKCYVPTWSSCVSVPFTGIASSIPRTTPGAGLTRMELGAG